MFATRRLSTPVDNTLWSRPRLLKVNYFNL